MIRILIFIGLKLWEMVKLGNAALRFLLYGMWIKLFKVICQNIRVCISTIVVLSPLFFMPIIWHFRDRDAVIGLILGFGLTLIIVIILCIFTAFELSIGEWLKSNWKKAEQIEKKWRKK